MRRPVKRICMLMSGLKRLKFYKLSKIKDVAPKKHDYKRSRVRVGVSEETWSPVF